MTKVTVYVSTLDRCKYMHFTLIGNKGGGC